MDNRDYKYRNRRFRTSGSTSRSVIGGIVSTLTAYFTVSAINDLRKENGLIQTTLRKLIKKQKEKMKKKKVITPE